MNEPLIAIIENFVSSDIYRKYLMNQLYIRLLLYYLFYQIHNISSHLVNNFFIIWIIHYVCMWQYRSTNYVKCNLRRPCSTLFVIFTSLIISNSLIGSKLSVYLALSYLGSRFYWNNIMFGNFLGTWPREHYEGQYRKIFSTKIHVQLLGRSKIMYSVQRISLNNLTDSYYFASLYFFKAYFLCVRTSNTINVVN